MSERPNALIVGAGKAGSTSLHNYLAAHPKVFGTDPKELMYFASHYGRGEEWYLSHFPMQDGVKVYFESSPQYTFRDEFPHVVDRIKNFDPGMKLIYIVREPISRIVSHYNHWSWSQPEEYTDIEASLASPKHRKYFIERSRYFYQISAYRDHFPDDQIHVLYLEDLKKNFEPTLDRAFEFLGVEPVAAQISTHIWNPGPGKRWSASDVSDERKDEIRSYLRDDVQALFEYTGKEPDFWNASYR